MQGILPLEFSDVWVNHALEGLFRGIVTRDETISFGNVWDGEVTSEIEEKPRTKGICT